MQTESPIQFTEMMNTALKFINSTGRHIFLTGKAGTGKTTFLKNLLFRTHKKSIIVAPTGIAALNAGGTTIHSQFLLPFGMFVPDRSYAEPPQEGANWYTENVLAKRHPLNSIRKQVLRSIDLLIIDEVSMLRADLLDAIDYRLRAVRGNFTQGFGGVQLLLIGDLYQLPPVITKAEASRMTQYYKRGWFFESKAIQRDGFTYIELNKIFRQKDESFITILNNLRANCPTREDIEALNKFYRSPEEIKNTRDVITLTTHNHMADSMNLQALKELSAASSFFNASIENDYPESMYPVLARLELKIGAQVMFTRNDSESGAYYNGKLASVESISGDNIMVRMADSDILFKLQKAVWENKKYSVNEETKELEEQIVGSFAQYPVKLAWAITVHKSQGLTFDTAIIDVGQAFADGQVYVALSRLRSLDGLILRTKVDPSVVSTDKHIVSFDESNNRPQVLGQEIKGQQREYILRQVNKTFDFTQLLREIQYATKDQSEGQEFADEILQPVLVQIQDALNTETVNTARFREQLKNLLADENDEQFMDRVRKGAEYYKKLLWNQVRKLTSHIEQQKSLKRNKGYLTNLKDIDQLLSKKLEENDKIINIADSIINETEEFDFVKSGTERAKMRETILQEAASVYTNTKPSKKTRKKGAKKGETHTASIDMAKYGMSVKEIAKERNLTAGTIESHLVHGIESGRIGIEVLLSDDEVREISPVLLEMPEGFTLMEIYKRFDGRFSFGVLRAMISHLGIQRKKKDEVESKD
ncbi:MAG: helix-turn-helix domain-containing protein [Chryseolinea sp.]